MKGKDLDINTGLQENFEGNAKTRKIFLLPFDLKAKDLKNTFITPSIIRKARKKSEEENQLPPQIESKRNRIFNPELKSLIGKVTASETETDSEKREELPEEEKEEPEGKVYFSSREEEELSIFYKVHVLGKQKEGLQQFFEKLIKRYSSEVFSLNYFSAFTSCFIPFVSSGFDQDMKLNFMFDKNDKVFKPEEVKIQIISIDDKMKADPYFQKKFSKRSLEEFNYLQQLYFHFPPVEFTLTLFYSSEPKTMDLEPLYEEVLQAKELIIPVINKEEEQNFHLESSRRDALNKLMLSLKHHTRDGALSFFIIKVKFSLLSEKDIFKEEERRKLLEDVSVLLREKEVVLEFSAHSFIFMAVENRKLEIEEFLNRRYGNRLNFILQSHKYPEEGRNLYMYF